MFWTWEPHSHAFPGHLTAGDVAWYWLKCILRSRWLGVTSRPAFLFRDIFFISGNRCIVLLYILLHYKCCVCLQSLGQVGSVIKLFPTGDVRVSVNGRTWTFNPLCMVPAPGENPPEAPRKLRSLLVQFQVLFLVLGLCTYSFSLHVWWSVSIHVLFYRINLLNL